MGPVAESIKLGIGTETTALPRDLALGPTLSAYCLALSMTLTGGL